MERRKNILLTSMRFIFVFLSLYGLSFLKSNDKLSKRAALTIAAQAGSRKPTPWTDAVQKTAVERLNKDDNKKEKKGQ